MNERFGKPTTAKTGSASRWLGVLVCGFFLTTALKAGERPPRRIPPRDPWATAVRDDRQFVRVAQEAESPLPDSPEPDTTQPETPQPDAEAPETAEPETAEPEPSQPEAEPSGQTQQPAAPEDVLELDIGELGDIEVEGNPFAPRSA